MKHLIKIGNHILELAEIHEEQTLTVTPIAFEIPSLIQSSDTKKTESDAKP